MVPDKILKKKHSGGNQNCSVPGCKAVRRKFPNVKFHFFPHPGQIIAIEDEFGQSQLVNRRLLWECNLKMGKEVSKWMSVCSLHFTENDYEQSGWSSVKKLKITSIPTQNLPVSSPILFKRTSNRKIKDQLYNCSKKIYMYKCPKCPRFRTKFLISLKTHIKSGHHIKKSEEDVYKCLKCLFVTHSKYFMVRHCYYNECITKKDDTKKLELTSRLQNKIESSFITYNEKSKLSKSERLIKLKENSKSTALKKTTKVSWFQCEHCSYKTKTRRNLTSHISSFHTTPEDTQWFLCINCPHKFKRKQDLKRHIFFYHNSEHSYCKPKDVGRFSCDQCPFTFRRNCQLTQHMKSHNSSWFKCDHCSYKCKSNERLTSHKNSRHLRLEDIKWFYCKQCSSKFKLKKNLKKHTAFFHIESKINHWLNCKHCPKKFKRKCNLERHMEFSHHSWPQPKPRK